LTTRAGRFGVPSLSKEIEMDESTRRLNEAFRDIIGRFEQDNMRNEAEAAKANPQAHKLSRVMAEGRLNYRYYDGGRDRRGRRVTYCYSTGRNVAGYFLTWRQVETPAKRKATKIGDLVSTIERDQWSASRSKKTIKGRAEARCKAYRARRRKPAGAAIA
jgi:hypothetical protein